MRKLKATNFPSFKMISLTPIPGRITPANDIKFEDNDRITRRLKRKKIIKVTNYIRDNIKQIKAEAENGQQDSQSMLLVYNEVINNHDLTSEDKYEKMLYWFFAEFQQFYAEA